VKEDTVAMLLPYMLAGLQKGVAADLRGASIMIFSQLAAKAPLGLKLLSSESPTPRHATLVTHDVLLACSLHQRCISSGVSV
jgi:hypothetical protein